MQPERVIRGGRVEADPWRVLAIDALDGPLPAGPILVPVPVWKARRGELLGRGEPTGVWLEPAEEPADLAADLAHFPLVAVRFPKFTDGRGYSIATLLRRRHGYRGELRAIGDVGRDQLFYLERCGFDSFGLPPHRDPEAALAGLQVFSVRYQGSADDPLPLFRKRAAA